MEEKGRQRVVAAAFIRKGDSVLLARRSLQKAIAPGRYHLPGGHVEFGESVEQAVVREIKEELGIDVQYMMPVYTFTYTNEQSHTIGVACWVTIIDDNQPLSYECTDNDKVVWATREEAIKVLSEPRDHNFDAVLEGFRVTDRAW